MNYLNARQRVANADGTPGNWDYTSRNDDHIYRIGYCAGWRDWPEEVRQSIGMKEEAYAEMETLKDRYHTDGHETEEEARLCYKRYMLDRAKFEIGERQSGVHCLACSNVPVGLARIPGEFRLFPLCAEHMNVESLDSALPTPGEIWTS